MTVKFLHKMPGLNRLFHRWELNSHRAHRKVEHQTCRICGQCEDVGYHLWRFSYAVICDPMMRYDQRFPGMWFDELEWTLPSLRQDIMRYTYGALESEMVEVSRG